mmetsp:Transcript_6251/g.15920  ORF Transcript_6251/g.15920 Transcript_6251/m.15920 type:complete len:114 (-) Transcript_6251:124-465(-)
MKGCEVKIGCTSFVIINGDSAAGHLPAAALAALVLELQGVVPVFYVNDAMANAVGITPPSATPTPAAAITQRGILYVNDAIPTYVGNDACKILAAPAMYSTCHAWMVKLESMI